jgi:hypothetical protein
MLEMENEDLLPVELGGIACAPSRAIRVGEGPLTAFVFFKTTAFDVQWVPVQLAQAAVRMAVERAATELGARLPHLISQTRAVVVPAH